MTLNPLRYYREIKAEIEKNRIVTVYLSRRCERLELAMDKLGDKHGIEWRDEQSDWLDRGV